MHLYDFGIITEGGYVKRNFSTVFIDRIDISRFIKQQLQRRTMWCHWDERASRRPWVLRSKYFKNQNVSYT